jgi:hypothetical protein
MSYSSDRPQYGYPGPPRWAGWDPGTFMGPFIGELSASRPLRILLVVLAFIWWWPIGLATLLFMMWSKRMGCWNNAPRGYRQNGQNQAQPRWGCWGRERTAQTSGNRAFDEYRAETLRRLEEEQRDFVGFLERLRFAKDKAEFDQFLAERRQRSENPPGTTPEAPEQPSPG